MHRANRPPQITYGLLLLSFLVSGMAVAGAVAAEQLAPAPRAVPTAGNGTGVVVPLGASRMLQMKNKKAIKQAFNSKKDVVDVTHVDNDPTSVLLSGKTAGTSILTLTGQDGTQEIYQIVVQIDLEELQSVLRKAVPTASFQLVPGAGSTVIITGTVTQREDIDIMMNTAKAFVPNVVSALRVSVSDMQAQTLQQLQVTLRHTFPTSNLHVVPGGGNTVLIGGDVAHAEDIELIMGTARGYSVNAINAMRVGGVMQVQLDVVLARVLRSELRGMAVDFLNTGGHHAFSSTPGGLLQFPTAITQSENNLNLTNVISQPPNLFLGLFSDQQQFFGLLRALRTESLAKVLAEPRLVTQSGRTATFVSGGDQPVPNGGGLGGVSFGFTRFGTTLTFLPIVLGNGKIFLEVEPEVSQIDFALTTPVPQTGGVIPGRSVQRVHTCVEMEDGQTFVIGGLIQQIKNGTTTKVPVLGDLPFFGAAFSSKSFEEREEELVVMVTPHLVHPMSCDQLPRLLPGQETRTPDDFELFLEGILEAPRGSRDVFPNRHYLPAYLNGPSATVYPCAGNGCGAGGCAKCEAVRVVTGHVEQPAHGAVSTIPGAPAANGPAPIEPAVNGTKPAPATTKSAAPLASSPPRQYNQVSKPVTKRDAGLLPPVELPEPAAPPR